MLTSWCGSAVRCEMEVLVLAELVREGWDRRMCTPPLAALRGVQRKKQSFAPDAVRAP
jgi:hypothetical protein